MGMNISLSQQIRNVSGFHDAFKLRQEALPKREAENLSVSSIKDKNCWTFTTISRFPDMSS
jgi:hypothetical protein